MTIVLSIGFPKLRQSFIALVAIIAGCGEESASDPLQSPVQVTVATPIVMPIVEWDEYTGRLDAIDSVEIRARVGGYLQSTHFAEGQSVQQGDLLAIIDPRPFEAELNGAKARLQEANAQLNQANALQKQAWAQQADAEARYQLAVRKLNRARLLAQSNATSKEEVDIRESEQLQATAAIEGANASIESAKASIATARAAIETAKAGVASAELNLEYTRVRAPVTGRISRRYVTEGNLISGGTTQSTLLTTILSLNPIHCYFDANELAFLKYVRLAQEGKRGSSRDVKNPVYVALVDEDGFPHAGHMDFVDNRVDPNTGTMRGRAILANDDGLLTPGLFVKLRLPGSGKYEAVLIPDSAVGSDQADRFVYVIDENESVARREVSLGPISHGLRIVRSGLDGSERIVIRGLQRVFPGVKVETLDEQLVVESNGPLSDDYEPVPKDEWLSRQPAGIPNGVKQQVSPYRDPGEE